MRRLLIGMVVAATTTLVPCWALAGNQEFAEQIAKSLRASGQMHDYKIGVMYQDGTAWLRGSVCDDEQARTAVDLVSQIPGVTRVENKLAVAPVAAAPTVAAQPSAGTTLQFARSDANLTTPQGKLQAAGTVFAPEQLPRVATTGVGGNPSSAGSWPASSLKRLQQRQEEAQPEPTAAQAVASSYTSAPAQRVAATESPRARPTPARNARPMPIAYMQQAQAAEPQPAPAPVPTPAMAAPMGGTPIPAYATGVGGGVTAARYDQARMPNHAWPSYAAYPNFAAVTYPRQYSPAAWPYIGPFYPYPQVPLGWRKVTLEWDDGWWMLDFKQ